MYGNKLRSFPAQRDFCPIDAIHGRVAGRSAAQGKHATLWHKSQMHQVALDLFGKIQRRQRGARSNGQVAKHCRCSRVRHGDEPWSSRSGQTATVEVAFQLYDPWCLKHNVNDRFPTKIAPMTIEQFRASVNQPSPPQGVAPLLEALWWDAKGDWDRAHEIAQDHPSPDAAWIHAYLHRKEGDQGNAGYWYQRARQPHARASLAQEWEQIAAALLARS
jgi:hypothetical protein